MAYSRRQVTDHVTKMNKDLYDNVQDGIDECKEDLEVVNTMLGSINEYNPNITYSKGSYVIHGETMYESVVDITLPEEWTVEHWKPATVLSLLQSVSADVPFKFGVDENGNYGFIKDGADTVTPFKQNHIYMDTIKFCGTASNIKGSQNYFCCNVKGCTTLKIGSIWFSLGSAMKKIYFTVLGGNIKPNVDTSVQDTVHGGNEPVYVWGETIFEVNLIKDDVDRGTLNDLEVDVSDFDYIILWLNTTKTQNYGGVYVALTQVDIS